MAEGCCLWPKGLSHSGRVLGCGSWLKGVGVLVMAEGCWGVGHG